MQVANLSRQTEAMTGKMEKLEDDKIRLTVRVSGILLIIYNISRNLPSES